MATIAGGFLDPFGSASEEEGAGDADWPVLRLVVRSVGALWLLAALLLAAVYHFVGLLTRVPDAD